MKYDAILYVSFGGPEAMADVMPYLDNVLRGKPVPLERKQEVAHHYERFGGKSPINDQNRAVISALERELQAHGHSLPVYFGNRNWRPYLTDAVTQMKQDGVRRALAFVTSGFSCYSGCRQYRENLADACASAGDDAPTIDKIRVFHNHPLFIEANVARVQEVWQSLPPDRQSAAWLLFTAHSIPQSMAEGSRYEEQLTEAARLVAEAVQPAGWRLVYQSRSGPPQQPWLEPDVLDVLPELYSTGCPQVVIVPIGFVSDHMEVLFDLDVEARELCDELGFPMVRAGTVGDHPQYVSMIRELIEERMESGVQPRSVGRYGPNPPVCPAGCCAYEPRRPQRAASPTSTTR